MCGGCGGWGELFLRKRGKSLPRHFSLFRGHAVSPRSNDKYPLAFYFMRHVMFAYLTSRASPLQVSAALVPPAPMPPKRKKAAAAAGPSPSTPVPGGVARGRNVKKKAFVALAANADEVLAPVRRLREQMIRSAEADARAATVAEAAAALRAGGGGGGASAVKDESEPGAGTAAAAVGKEEEGGRRQVHPVGRPVPDHRGGRDVLHRGRRGHRGPGRQDRPPDPGQEGLLPRHSQPLRHQPDLRPGARPDRPGYQARDPVLPQRQGDPQGGHHHPRPPPPPHRAAKAHPHHQA